MHPFLLYLRNAFLGALLGLVAAMIGSLVYAPVLYPRWPLAGLSGDGILLAGTNAQMTVLIGLITALLLARRALRRAKQNVPPPTPPPADDKHVWPPPPTRP